MPFVHRACAAALLGLAAAPAVAEPIEFSIFAGVRGAYESNVYRLSPGEQRRFDYPSFDDFYIAPQGAVVARLPIGLQQVELRAAGGYRFYRYNTTLDSQDTLLSAKLDWRLPVACTGSLLAEQTNRLAELEDEDDFDEPPEQNVQRGRRGVAEARCAITPELALRGVAEYAERTNDNVRRRRFDLEETGFTVRLDYGLPGTIQPFIAARYREREQPNFFSRAPGRRGGEADIVDLGGGATWELPFLTLSAEGYATRLRENSDRRNSDSLTYLLSADWEITAKTKLRLYAERLIESSPSIGAITFPVTAQGAVATWTATPMLTASFAVRHKTRDILRDRFPRRLQPRSRFEEDETWSIEATTTYAITDGIDLRAGLLHRDRDAVCTEFSALGEPLNPRRVRLTCFEQRFQATTVTLGLTYRFAGPPIDTGL